ncbi:hypothetical protein VE03_10889 [Pseudogymnoascus sp. 23342-1-I1]|nr:hypothetical protein VE03_10889 [Pseudogymnoascus sp. 23342-1-I1]
MDEESLRASCGAHSFYISLQDQKGVDETISRPTGLTVSKEQTTQIHLALFRSRNSFNVTFATPGAVKGLLEGASNKSHGTIIASISHPSELTCEKRAEHALATYIQRGGERENLSEDSNLDGVHDEVVNQLKRRQLDTSHDQNHEISDDNDIRNGNSVGAWSTVHTLGTKRRRLRSSGNGEDNSTGNTVEVESTAEIQLAEFRLAKINPLVQDSVEDISAKIAKKILSGLDGMRLKEKKRPKKTGKTKPNAAVIDGAIGDIELGDRLAYLEIFLLEQSSSLIKSTHETAWKSVAEIGRNTTLAIESKDRISADAAKCMKRVPHKVHTSGQTAFISRNLETEARSSLHGLGAEYQHRAGPSSEATFNGNRPQAPTNVLDGAMTDCIDPRLTSLLHSSSYLPSVEPSLRDGAICPSMLMIDPFMTDSLHMSDTLPSLGEEAMHPTTVPFLTSSLHKSDDVPSALGLSTDQGATDLTAFMIDPYLTDSLYTLGYLPSVVEPSSPSLDQGGSCPSTLMIDPHLTHLLHMSDSLPGSLEPSVGQGAINSNNGCSGEASTGLDYFEHETHAL